MQDHARGIDDGREGRTERELKPFVEGRSQLPGRICSQRIFAAADRAAHVGKQILEFADHEWSAGSDNPLRDPGLEQEPVDCRDATETLLR